MVKVVYFNQWFSSIAWVIDDLKKRNRNEVKIIASSKNPNHTYKDYVDEFIVEDWEETDNHEESMKNYIEWLFELCMKYHVDYFFVKKHMEDVTKQRAEFSMRGTFLACETDYVVKQLESKASVYNKLKETSLKRYIPEYLKTTDIREAIEYLESHRGYDNVCLKFDNDEGGASFRAIKDSRPTLNSLYEFMVNQLTTDEAEHIVTTSSDGPSRLIFMEMLDSPEISVDCYNSKNGFVAICRSKEEGRKEKIYYDEYIYNICKEIRDIYKFNFPFNVQFRYKHKESGKYSRRDLRILEINTRMSGGLYYEVANGLNIADLCLKDCMNRNNEYTIDEYIKFKPKYVTHLELPIKL